MSFPCFLTCLMYVTCCYMVMSLYHLCWPPPSTELGVVALTPPVTPFCWTGWRKVVGGEYSSSSSSLELGSNILYLKCGE